MDLTFIFPGARCEIFNFFFVFGGRPFIRLLPVPVQYLFTVLITATSTLWLYRTWQRSPNLYLRESLASRLRKQLGKLKLDIPRFLEGRSLDDLSADEVYVLAKILPDFSKEKRLQAYKAVVQEAIEEGYVESSNSLEILQQMRRELDITDKEHQTVLTELGFENPDLLNPTKQHSREDWLRLESYRETFLNTVLESWKHHPAQGLMADLFDVATGKKPPSSIGELLNHLSNEDAKTVQTIRQEYAITDEEEKDILKRMDPNQLWQSIAHTLDVLDRLDSITTQPKPANIDWMSDEQIALCKETFKKFDKDGNDRLSVAELCSVLRAVGRPYSAKRVQDVMDGITGRPNSDSISFFEFAILLQRDLSESDDNRLLER